MEQIEKTCENCKYDYEDMEGSHCRHCIHNAVENFEPKENELSETEIRNKAIEEFAERLITNAESFTAEVNGIRADLMTHDYFMEFVDEIAESMKGE